MIQTFVIDDKKLIIVFQPHVVGCVDETFHVKIPFSDINHFCDIPHPIYNVFFKNVDTFISSWNGEDFCYKVD